MDQSETDSPWMLVANKKNTPHISSSSTKNESKAEDLNAIISIPCKFYLMGNCSSGKSCRYLHIANRQLKNHSELKAKSPDMLSSSLVCSYYLKKNCKFGLRCMFRHSEPKFNYLEAQIDLSDSKSSISLGSIGDLKKDDKPALENFSDKSIFYNFTNLTNTREEQFSSLSNMELSSSSSLGYDKSLFDDLDDENLFALTTAEFNSWGLKTPNVNSPLDIDEHLSDQRTSLAAFAYLAKSDGDVNINQNTKRTNSTMSYSTALKMSFSKDRNHEGLSIEQHVDQNSKHKIIIEQRSDAICSYAKIGSCTFGDRCKNVHGLRCSFCLLFVLHPTNFLEREKHIRECKLSNNIPVSSVSHEETVSHPELSSELECGICLESLIVNGTTRFGLLNCNHSFCLECVRTWRASQNIDPSVVRSCPICRVVTYFITPSHIWTTDPSAKSEIIEDYKKKLSAISCKYFRNGKAVCPFGNSCFYAHLGKDGNPVEPNKIRICINEAGEYTVLSS